MNREELLKKMRDDYRNRDFISLRRHFNMGQWLLNDEDKAKVRMVLEKIEAEQTKNLPPLVLHALKVLGGRIVEGPGS